MVQQDQPAVVVEYQGAEDLAEDFPAEQEVSEADSPADLPVEESVALVVLPVVESAVEGGPGGAGGTVEAPVLTTFRLIIGTTDGKKSEVYVPADTSTASEEGWKNVAIPLQAITGLDRTNKTIQSISIGANTIATFYVGDLRVVDDSTPIRGEMIPDVTEMNLALGDEVTFSAAGRGGSSILRYTWDFDDRDGIQVDADGQTVNRKFRKAGTYTVTCTISDFYGLKPSYAVKTKVTVNP